MRNFMLFLIAAFLMEVVGSCSKVKVIPETATENEQETPRILLLSATFPSHEPTTKVALTQEEDKTIALTWETGDQLQLAFVKVGETTVKQIVTIRNISPNKKRAEFDITLPSGFDSGTFDLYGVYGGGGIDITGANPVAVLPSNAGNATSLNDNGDASSIEEREDVMLYFASTGIDATAPNVSVTFTHLGSLFNITLENTSETETLSGLYAAKLVGLNLSNNSNWAYNIGAGGKTFDLVDKKFLGTGDNEGNGNYISFKAKEQNLAPGAEMFFWAWYPPLPYERWNKTNIWPELKLELINSLETLIKESINTKLARNSQTAAGKSFSFYAEWDGADLKITNPPTGPYEYFVSVMGTLNTVLGAKKDTITKMILKGRINSSDFSVMKNDMPLLTHLVLNDVTCSDNKILQFAFSHWSTGANVVITTIVLPKSITTIEKEAFKNCSSLSGTIVFPSSLTSIERDAFIGCNSVNAFNLPHTTPFTYTANMLPTTATVQVPAAAVAAYQSAEGWKNHTIVGY